MKKRTRSLRHQMGHIMTNAKAFGQSKRSYRKQTNEKKSDKIFSYSNYDSIKQTAESLVKFINENYSEIKELRQIKQVHITKFLEKKAETCNDSTLVKMQQHIESLALFAQNAFRMKFNWTVDRVYSKKQYQYTKKGRAMSVENFDKLEKYLEENCNKQTESNTLLLIRFCRATGLRVDEIAHQRIDDIHLDAGEFGYGYIDVTNGKHGRKRYANIKSEEDRKIVEEVILNADKEEIEYVTIRRTETLKNRLTNAKKKAGIEDDLVGWHGIRKLHAQEFYDYVRKNISRRDAIGLTNQQLGHGYDRGEEALKTYVGNIW